MIWWFLAISGVAQSWTRLKRLSSSSSILHVNFSECLTHSSVLAWRIPGKEEPGGLPSMGSHRVGHDWSDLAAAAATSPVITHLEPDILECEVKWALESITTNKASGGDGIPVELFQILKDNVVKVLHSICQQIWKAVVEGDDILVVVVIIFWVLCRKGQEGGNFQSPYIPPKPIN